MKRWRPYWREHLGRTTGDTFLMECFPVPRKSLNTRIPGYNHVRVWCERVEHLRRFATTTEPNYVVAYGNDASERVEAVFPVVRSEFDERSSDWHDVQGCKRTSIGKTAYGGVVAKVGFFGNGGFRLNDMVSTRDAMWKLGSGKCPLDLQPGAVPQ